MSLLTNLWRQMWPNIFAPGFWTLLGIGLSHWHNRKKLNEMHKEIKEGKSKVTPLPPKNSDILFCALMSGEMRVNPDLAAAL